ncbi:MAG TPA: ABC transporter permease subunit [Caulobacteraceae bacterium]|jgi:iron(III) transport system permease protein
MSVSIPQPRGRTQAWSAPSPLRLAAYAAAALAVLPLASVVWLAVSGTGAAAMPPQLIGRYALTSAALAASVAVGTTVLGASAAWLVVMYRFPGRGLFAWALALPLAAPAFALAYGYADLLDVAGPARLAFQSATGLAAWPFDIRGLPGAALVLSLALYPYVYLTARAAFITQSVCALEAARTLGASPREVFRRVALPLARPAIAAGAALAVMETLADYGAVNFLGVQTLTTGVVRAWSVFGSPASAARLSLVLLAAAALLLWLERANRLGESYHATSVRWRTLAETPLSGWRPWAATLFCALLLTLALLLPAGWLLARGLSASPDLAALGRAATVSLGMAIVGAALTVALAAVLALGERKGHAAKRIASLGYATPGAVMAVGLLAPAALLWGVGGAAQGAAAGLALLLFAYAARLMASALQPIEAGLTRITPSVEQAARSLGATEAAALRRVHLPMVRAALWTAALLVFVDVMKELPATLMLRPFDFDTLAVLADRYANDERLAQAAWPALLIVAAAVGPVVFLSRKVAGSRPGDRP